MTTWCPRCGCDRAEDDLLPCDMCWDGRGGEELVERLMEWIASGVPGALRVLGRIGDTEAAPALRRLCRHDDPGVRAAAVRALGWSGSTHDVPLLAALSRDGEAVGAEAIASLAEIGGPDAADALASMLPDATTRGRRKAVLVGLSWLKDPRAVAGWHPLLDEAILDDDGAEGRGVMWALLRTGNDVDREALEETVVGLFRRDAALGGGTTATTHRVARQLWSRLFEIDPEGADRFLERITVVDPAAHFSVPTRKRLPERFRILTPLGERTVPRLAFAPELRADTPDDALWPPAKFGGPPDWRQAHAWPLTDTGRPMVMFAQLPLDAENLRTAYVFLNLSWDAHTFDPSSGDSRVIVQSGPAGPRPAAGRGATGPVLHTTVHEMRFRRRNRGLPYERWAALEPGRDPTKWEWPPMDPDAHYRDDHGDWAKIGGTPRWLQGDNAPEGEWRFAFQFSAGWAGRELGDGAECYGFVGDDDRGLFLWQCH